MPTGYRAPPVPPPLGTVWWIVEKYRQHLGMSMSAFSEAADLGAATYRKLSLSGWDGRGSTQEKVLQYLESQGIDRWEIYAKLGGPNAQQILEHRGYEPEAVRRALVAVATYESDASTGRLVELAEQLLSFGKSQSPAGQADRQNRALDHAHPLLLQERTDQPVRAKKPARSKKRRPRVPPRPRKDPG